MALTPTTYSALPPGLLLLVPCAWHGHRVPTPAIPVPPLPTYGMLQGRRLPTHSPLQGSLYLCRAWAPNAHSRPPCGSFVSAQRADVVWHGLSLASLGFFHLWAASCWPELWQGYCLLKGSGVMDAHAATKHMLVAIFRVTHETLLRNFPNEPSMFSMVKYLTRGRQSLPCTH